MGKIPQKNGFTLTELIIVIVVVAIVSAALFVRWPKLSLNVSSQAALFADDLRSTQSLAMTHGERYSLTKISSASYAITNSSGAVYLNTTLAPNISFSSFPDTIINGTISFATNGVPYTGTLSSALSADSVITLMATDGTAATVTISSVTGRVLP